MSLRRIFMIAMTMFLAACAFDEGEGAREQDNRVEEERREAARQIERIAGTWTGDLIRGNDAIPLQLDIGIELSRDGRTGDGRTIFRYDVSGNLRSSTDTRYTGNFVGAYDPATGLILLKNETASRADDLRTLSLEFNGAEINGSLAAVQYNVGKVIFRRAPNQSDESPEDEEDRLNELERTILRQATGSFYGTVNSDSGGCRRYNICVTIDLEDTPTPRGGRKSSLRGYYYREDMTPGRLTGERNMKIDYYHRLTPKTIYITSKDVPSQPYNSPFTVSLFGSIAEMRTDPATGAPRLMKIKGQHKVENLGQSGTFELTRVPACPARPDPGRCLSRASGSGN